MCRIAGIVNAGYATESLKNIVREMCDLQKHGGPDDEGILSMQQHCVLGNRRLALLDLSTAGHQPMQLNDRYSLTYNGELYNFISLKEELSGLGHKFTTHTDTEVILAAFAQWNSQSFCRLKGMFAFALCDSYTQELFLVRDPAGMKPLYYSNASNGLCFASELRAFGPVPYLQESNPDWPVYLMAYGHIPEPVTTKRSVQPLHKGCFLKYDISSGEHSMQSFTHYSFSEHQQPVDNVKQALKQKMYDSVERHLIADAPIGVFLSGGLDSGIIATIASSFKKSRLNTFSLYFQEAAYSEKKYQDLVLKELQCNAYQHLLKEDEFHVCFPQILKDMDMPGCDGINTWFISKYARQEGLKAVLSGIGGDELFGGYPSFSRIRIASLLQRVPAIAINRGKRSSLKQFNRLSYLKMDGIKGVYLFLRGHFSPFEIARQLGADEKQIWDILNDLPVINEISGLSQKNQASWMEFNLYMQNQLLRDADVMGMAHGVEIRVPFLDDELVRFAMSVKPEIKYAGNLPKQIMIDTFKQILPKPVWDRPKMGFSFPFAEWLADSEFAKEIINGSAVTEYNYKRFLEGKMHWSQLMSLIILRNKGKI